MAKNVKGSGRASALFGSQAMQMEDGYHFAPSKDLYVMESFVVKTTNLAAVSDAFDLVPSAERMKLQSVLSPQGNWA